MELPLSYVCVQVCVCLCVPACESAHVLNVIALVRYGVELVAEQQWGSALEWASLKEE